MKRIAVWASATSAVVADAPLKRGYWSRTGKPSGVITSAHHLQTIRPLIAAVTVLLLGVFFRRTSKVDAGQVVEKHFEVRVKQIRPVWRSHRNSSCLCSSTRSRKRYKRSFSATAKSVPRRCPPVVRPALEAPALFGDNTIRLDSRLSERMVLWHAIPLNSLWL